MKLYTHENAWFLQSTKIISLENEKFTVHYFAWIYLFLSYSFIDISLFFILIHWYIFFFILIHWCIFFVYSFIDELQFLLKKTKQNNHLLSTSSYIQHIKFFNLNWNVSIVVIWIYNLYFENNDMDISHIVRKKYSSK